MTSLLPAPPLLLALVLVLASTSSGVGDDRGGKGDRRGWWRAVSSSAAHAHPLKSAEPERETSKSGSDGGATMATPLVYTGATSAGLRLSYVSFLCDDTMLAAARVMAASLRDHTRLPLVMMVLSDVSAAGVKDLLGDGVEVVLVRQGWWVGGWWDACESVSECEEWV